ncbi:MAG: branched-chain amino acid ABC transporter permease [Armatimonadota bacterium]
MQELTQQILNGLIWGGVYALIALGYTMVYGVLRLINFAHGDVYMVGAYIAFYTVAALGGGPVTPAGVLLVFLASMAGSALLGVTIERGAYRPVRSAPRLTALITAIGVSLFLENGGQLVFGPNPRAFPQVLAVREVFRVGEVAVTSLQVAILASVAVLLVLLELLVHKTRVGKAMRATAYNRTVASLMGVNTDNIISLTFAVGSALAAVAGILVGLYTGTIDPLMGLLPGLKAFVAAVVGGIGSIPGAMLGGFVLGMSEVMVVALGYSTYRDAIAFALLVLILLLRPTGLLGTGAVEKV